MDFARKLFRGRRAETAAERCGLRRNGSAAVKRHVCRVIAGLALGAVVLGGCARQPAPRFSFNEVVQPILSENCYGCHGPSSSSRKAELRLDHPEFAYAPHASFGPAIIPGRPESSPLVRRIEAQNPDERMPPPETRKILKPEQIAALRQWIKEGAHYETHWAFVAPKRAPLPVTSRKDWAQTDIDRFILARLEKEALAPSPQADRRTLIRRVTYDLTGLPPTPEEVEAFVADRSRDAYEKLVDRLLASPRYGEHRAHYWLDVARYGDTHGLHLDNFRSIWPYRDYVIRAFNENKPYDQFVREQLAGDLLPAQRPDQLVASAFIRSGISSGEGGTLVEELRVNNKRERTEAYGAAFLGLTVGCANCHDHKFDPLTQKDFYRLTAFFNNLTEDPSNDDRNDWPPFIRLPKPENRAAYDQVFAKRSVVQRQISVRRDHARELIATWLARPAAAAQPVSPDGLLVQLRLDEQKGATFINAAPGASPKTVTATGGAPVWGENTWFWPSMRMDTSTRVELKGIGDVEANQAFSVGTWLMPYLETASSESAHFGAIVAHVDSAQQGRGWELYYTEEKPKPKQPLFKGRLVLHLTHAWPANALDVETQSLLLERGHWNHVLATYDGSGRASGVQLYIDGQPQALKVVKDTLSGTIRNAAPLEFGRQYPDANPLRQSRYQDFRYYARALRPEEAARVPREDFVSGIVRRPMASWTEDEFKAVSDFYFAQVDGPTRALVAQLPALNGELDRLAQEGDIALVSEEGTGLAYADVLYRGLYNQRRERVRPGVPGFLPPLPPGAPLDRRGLAEWTVSAANPLTARVAVNRMWQELFGTGLVETTEDFGTVGARPSHPALLDWLAVDFREHAWNVKRFYKQLVMSAAYQQAAQVTAALLEKDPKNRLLARGPRFRMDAEMLRDTALATSGLLVERIGGPSVKPYQPAGVWEAGGFPSSDTTKYQQDHGESLYRRSLYTFWKRMATMPSMDSFDAPVRDAACTRRQRTNTPLQALVMMNDPQWLEAARNLAERVVTHDAATGARLDYLGELLLARPWHAQERALLEGTLTRFDAAYAHDATAAQKLIAVGESRPDKAITAPVLAPWMLLASAAMNLDATLNK
jgi:Protein of unknown function (DUF1553)/Protein of unknown function (DUF1549)/Planctomycete cytochrome C/Concanavalin A-like lectin/glucanases superfamily